MKITGVISNSKFKRKLSWFMVLMVWVGMVTAVVIHREPTIDNHLAEVSSTEGYVEIDEQQENNNNQIEEELNSLNDNPVVNVANVDDKKNKTDFFVEYRIERDQARSEQINLLREMINNPNSDKGLKKKAQERLLEITNNIEKEMDIESLIRARGYNDGIAFIHDNSIELIISSDGLNKDDVAKIGDIITNSTGINLENITIIER